MSVRVEGDLSEGTEAPQTGKSKKINYPLEFPGRNDVSQAKPSFDF